MFHSLIIFQVYWSRQPRVFRRLKSLLWIFAQDGSVTVVLCAEIQNDWVTEKYVMGERNFTRFGFKMRFGRISYIAQRAENI